MKIMPPVTSIFLGLIAGWMFLSDVSTASANEGVPALPGEHCSTKPRRGWSEPEKWVWKQVCEGKIANFNERYKKELNPGTPDGWSKNREIGPVFLETILLHEPYRSALPHEGVRIVGAWVRHLVEMENATLRHMWWLERSRIEADVNLRFLNSTCPILFAKSVFTGTVDLSLSKIGGVLDMTGAKCTGKLNMNQLKVTGVLFMRNGAEFSEIDLGGAKIGQVDMTGAKCTGKLSMNQIEVAGSLFMRNGAEFSEIDLVGAKIGQVDMTGAKCTGKLSMQELKVTGSLLMRNGAEFSEIDLISAKIGEVLDMSGAKCTGKLNMNQIEVTGVLLMSDKAEFSEIDLVGAKVGHLEMIGAKCTGKLIMNQLKVAGGLFMRKGAEFSEIDLGIAKIGGVLDMTGAKCTGKLSMNQIEVAGGLFMSDKAEFSEIDLVGAKVGHLDMTGAKCTGKLNMNQLKVTGSLFMSDKAEFSEIDLGGAKIGQVDMTGAKCTGKLSMNQIEVAGGLFMSDKAEFSEIDLGGAKIGGGLYIWGSRFASIDLTDSSIKIVLNLGIDDRSKPKWSGKSPRLLLRNTVVDSMQAPPQLDAFPNDLDLNGFKYSHLGEWRGADGESEMASRKSKWFTDWLGKDRGYSPQPYHQLAEVLRTMGHPGKAKDILYAGKERERSEAWKRWEVSNWLWLSLLNCTIAYGYHYYYITHWVILLILLGAWIYGKTAPGKASNWMARLIFSFDLLLPLVKLNENNYKIPISGWQLYYFYFHKLIGYVLGLIIIAGISGIIK